MNNFDIYTNENKTEYNSKWSYIPDHPYRILITGGSASGKTNTLLRWCRARDLFGSQIPVTTGGFELRISCIRSICDPNKS